MAGGPSQIDTLDPKPDRPPENRGPFGVTKTKLPGVLVCEHLPKLAAMLDRFTVIRSVDCRHSNHEPNTVMQTANLLAEPRTNPEARSYPAIALARREVPRRRTTRPCRPTSRSCGRGRHLAFGGYLGKQYDPFLANEAAQAAGLRPRRQGHRASSPAGKMFELPAGVSAGPHGRPAQSLLAELRPAPRRHRRVRRDGGDWTGTASRRSRC